MCDINLNYSWILIGYVKWNPWKLPTSQPKSCQKTIKSFDECNGRANVLIEPIKAFQNLSKPCRVATVKRSLLLDYYQLEEKSSFNAGCVYENANFGQYKDFKDTDA